MAKATVKKPPPTVPWSALRKSIIGVGTTAAALTAIGSLWLSLGFPRLATSADIAKLTSQQADIAVDLYSKNVRDLLVTRSTTKSDPATQAIVDQQLGDAQTKLKQAQERKIDLAK